MKSEVKGRISSLLKPEWGWFEQLSKFVYTYYERSWALMIINYIQVT